MKNPLVGFSPKKDPLERASRKVSFFILAFDEIAHVAGANGQSSTVQ